MSKGLNFVEKYDYSRVAAHLTRDGMTECAAQEAIENLRRFMYLAALYYDEPHGLVVWEGAEPALHALILDTQAYRDYCMQAFGQPMHHDPHAFGTEVFRGQWKKTVELARKHLGIALNPDPDAKSRGARDWNIAAYCSFLGEMPLAA